MEGLDIRTLAFTSIMLGGFLGIGSLLFAQVHITYKRFKPLALSYFIFAVGSLLVALRDVIPDFLSVIIANLLIVFSYRLLIVVILIFFGYDTRRFIKISNVILVLFPLSFIYFTYVHEYINIRIAIISLVLGLGSLLVTVELLLQKGKSADIKEIRIFKVFLGYCFLYASIIWLLRFYMAMNEPFIHDFMETGSIHAMSLLAVQLTSVGSCFALSLSASHTLAAELTIKASIDELTNIYNRRSFNEFAQQGIARAQREKTPISLILMDIDLFKAVNDNYGHQVGDKVLQEFSLRLKSSLREYDVLARYGGEEFTLLLPNTNAMTAMIIAEKLRHTIAQPVFYLENKAELSVTASFGVATNQGEDVSWQQLMSFADQALYKAKANGRNCVKLHRAEVHQMPNAEKSY